jgi:hypothetical protein
MCNFRYKWISALFFVAQTRYQGSSQLVACSATVCRIVLRAAALYGVLYVQLMSF